MMRAGTPIHPPHEDALALNASEQLRFHWHNTTPANRFPSVMGSRVARPPARIRPNHVPVAMTERVHLAEPCALPRSATPMWRVWRGADLCFHACQAIACDTPHGLTKVCDTPHGLTKHNLSVMETSQWANAGRRDLCEANDQQYWSQTTYTSNLLWMRTQWRYRALAARLYTAFANDKVCSRLYVRNRQRVHVGERGFVNAAGGRPNGCQPMTKRGSRFCSTRCMPDLQHSEDKP